MEKKSIRLTESDLKKIIKKVISEIGTGYEMNQGYRDNTYVKPPVIPPPPANTTSSNKTNDDIKTKKFPCFTSTSVPYDYNPKKGDTVGNYVPAKMDFLRMFKDNSIIVAWENNTIKEYVRNGNAAGAETKKGTWKCKSDNSGVDVVLKDTKPVSQPSKQSVKPVGTSKPNTKESAIGVVYQYEYPNDKKYVYGVKDGKWYSKTLVSGKEFDISVFPTSVANLNKQFPGALKGIAEPPLPPKPTAPNPETATPGLVQEPTSGKQAYNPNDVS